MNRFFDMIRGWGVRRGPQRLLGGISAPIARMLGTDVWVARLLVLVLFLLPGIGLGTYLVAWLLLPWQDGSIPLENLLGGRRL